jgi:hypothetical protein
MSIQVKSLSAGNAAITALASLFFLLQGCWIPSAIWQPGNPYNLPGWPEKPDKNHAMPDFKVGDRFVLSKPMLLQKNTLIKPPYFLGRTKSGSSELVAKLPVGTVIRIVALKDGTVSGSGVDEYVVIEGMEEFGWIFVSGGPKLETINGKNYYKFDEEWIRKL